MNIDASEAESPTEEASCALTSGDNSAEQTELQASSAQNETLQEQSQQAATVQPQKDTEGQTAQHETELDAETTESTPCTGDVSEAVRPKKRPFASRLFDVLLWVLIAVLAVAVCLRLFVFGRITVVGKSMTAEYYTNEALTSYNVELTYHDGDVVHVNKLVKPNRGDVAVFYKQSVNKFGAIFATANDETYKKLIKRIVALGGDQLSLEQEGEAHYRLVIVTPDGETLYEDYYVKDGTVLDADAFLLSSDDDLGLGCLKNAVQGSPDFVPYTVAENCFFALGDNRAHSDDSRGKLGDVPLEQLYGVVF